MLQHGLSSGTGDLVRRAMRSLITHLSLDDCLVLLSKVIAGCASVFVQDVPSLAWTSETARLIPKVSPESIRRLLTRPELVPPEHYYDCIERLLAALANGLDAALSMRMGNDHIADATYAVLAALDSVSSIPGQFRSPNSYAIWRAHERWNACSRYGPEPPKGNAPSQEEGLNYVERGLGEALEWLVTLVGTDATEEDSP